jgi:hypothetical protein
MTKIQLIDAIREHNRSVKVEFLEQFDEPALQQYLTALENAGRRTLKMPVWVRQQPKLKMVS